MKVCEKSYPTSEIANDEQGKLFFPTVCSPAHHHSYDSGRGKVKGFGSPLFPPLLKKGRVLRFLSFKPLPHLPKFTI